MGEPTVIPTTYAIRDRGPTPRGMRRVMNASAKKAWFETGVEFHSTMSDDRFTHAHATKANYAPRSKKYEQIKLKRYGHTYPLQFSGRTRRLVRTANITSTSNGVNVRYPGARVFNFRNPKMKANMVEEFTKVLPDEAARLTAHFDKVLDLKLNADNGVNQ